MLIAAPKTPESWITISNLSDLMLCALLNIGKCSVGLSLVFPA